MDHSSAVQTEAVERYLLGEMEPGERDDFEEHYFSCVECGESVRLAATLRAGARRVLAERAASESKAVRRSFWPKWFSFPMMAPVAVSMALALVLVYQNAVTIPALRTGQIIPSVALHSASRGDDSLAAVPAGGAFFTLYFDLPPGLAYRMYRYTVVDGSQHRVMEITGPATAGSASLLLNRSAVGPGRYLLRVQGLNGSQGEGVDLATYHFVVQ